MADEIIEELWRAKDKIAREHGNDVHQLGKYLRSVAGRTASDLLEELKNKSAEQEPGNTDVPTVAASSSRSP